MRLSCTNHPYSKIPWQTNERELPPKQTYIAVRQGLKRGETKPVLKLTTAQHVAATLIYSCVSKEQNLRHRCSTHYYRVEHPQLLIAGEAEMHSRNGRPPQKNNDTEIIEQITAPGHQLAVVLKNVEPVPDELSDYQFWTAALTSPNK